MAETAEERVIKNLKTIEEWALQGMTEKEMAECLDVGYSTFRKIKKENIALLALLKQCANTRKKVEEEQVKSVERSLFERARGYEVEEVIPIKVKKTYFNEAGEKYVDEEVVESKSIKHIPADIQAAKFFLVNKARKMWQDNPHKVENDKKLLTLREKEAEGKEW